MWYAYEGEWMNWHLITIEQANEIIEINKQKKKVASLEEYAADLTVDTKTEFENVVGQDSLTRFDKPKHNKKRKTNKNRKRNRPNKVEAKSNTNTNSNSNNQKRRPKKRRPNKNKPNNNNENK